MTATDGFTRQVEEGFAPGYFPDHLGLELVHWSEGWVRARMPFRPAHRQNHGVIQGGATAALIDVAMAWAVASVVHPFLAPTVDLTVHYLRPVVNEALECEAVVAKAGRSIATARAEVVTDAGVVVAIGTGTFVVRPNRQEE